MPQPSGVKTSSSRLSGVPAGNTWARATPPCSAFRMQAALGSIPVRMAPDHIYVGDMDNYYLNNAVKLTEDFLEATSDPPYGGEVDYGDGDEHCWNGDHTRGNGLSRLRYIQMFAPRIVERIRESAPRGADASSWRP